jgi:4'-phosphopantetheinyl transferase
VTQTTEALGDGSPLAGIRSGEVHTWLISLAAELAEVSELAAVLEPRESARATALRTERLRRRYVVAHATMRAVLASYLDCAPSDVGLRSAPGGKPELRDGSGVCFNLSHSHELAALAVVFGRSVGIDVELCDGARVRPGLVSRALSASEAATLSAAPESTRPVLFFHMWTAKEAVLKARGVGLRGGLDRVQVALEADRLHVRELDPSLAGPAGWEVAALPLTDGYVGAVAVEPPAGTLRCRWWRRG